MAPPDAQSPALRVRAVAMASSRRSAAAPQGVMAAEPAAVFLCGGDHVVPRQPDIGEHPVIGVHQQRELPGIARAIGPARAGRASRADDPLTAESLPRVRAARSCGAE